MSQFSSGTDMYHNLSPGRAQQSTIFELPEKAYISGRVVNLYSHCIVFASICIHDSLCILCPEAIKWTHYGEIDYIDAHSTTPKLLNRYLVVQDLHLKFWDEYDFGSYPSKLH